jgi:hypothetical protein
LTSNNFHKRLSSEKELPPALRREPGGVQIRASGEQISSL